ncbi:putative glycerol-3-phosphate transporter 5 isoform X1 [Pecten maximus]|uniref:putative glycerol-3-phosphate transporter 5 isoform X1 n=1 Tax=Pecten maximus TaxID=6579 RepID=UPI001458CB78|nr:putative glycerol-3-phosphate transporter 5 isoform X1 [Pecten maximus]
MAMNGSFDRPKGPRDGCCITAMLKTPLYRRQLLVFCLGWMAYASTYFLRKPLGVVKTDLETDLHISKTQLGWLDTALLLPYAVVQMLLGNVGDKFGARRTYGVCLILSAISMFTFGQWSNVYMFAGLLFMNGAAQSQCWPNCMKALGAWYPDKVRNSIFGMFGTCAFAGGIMGTGLAVYLQSAYGWRSAFLLPSVFVGVLGVLVLLFFQQPDEVGIEVPGKGETTAAANATSSKTAGKISWLQLWKIPMLAEVAVAVFCLKVVRYCMYMWLPLYLLDHLKYSKAQAGMFSTIFEVGGVFGSAVIGFVIDAVFWGRSLSGSAVSSLLSAISLLGFVLTSSWGIWFNGLFLFLAGVFNCGPDSILGGAIPAQLGEMDGRNAAAATIGLVNGFGSVGTFMEGPIIGVISTWYGWSGMFYFMIGLSFMGTLSVYRAAGKFNKSTTRTIPEAEPLALDKDDTV